MRGLLPALVGFSILVSAALVGCGGSGGDGAPDETAGQGAETSKCESLPGEAQREECERAVIAARIPEADRIAYYQLATTAGLLRASAVAVQRGDPRPATARLPHLRAARARIMRADPRDRGLAQLRREILALLGKESSGGLGPAEARRTLAQLRRIDRRLGIYLRKREPAQASLLPD